MFRFLFRSIRFQSCRKSFYAPIRSKGDDSSSGPVNVSSLFKPVPIRTNPDDINVGEELTGSLNKADLLKLLNKFYQGKEIRSLLSENGLDNYLQHNAYISFRRYCLESETLPTDLHVTFSDILQGARHVDDIFPYFLRHAKEVYPHLECMDDLKKISDLRMPSNWYPEARAIRRKIVFHAGPTNSGKTYHALKRFMTSKSGIYCGPLKLLASEVFHKANANGTSCDLVTGEERRFAKKDNDPSSHVSCTVEMASITFPYEVAVIDEIQMIRDIVRGWAWTRVLLGLVAEEIHLCGELGAFNLVRDICMTTGEEVELHEYNRLTKLQIENKALLRLDNIEPGDCVVCFNKNDIYSVSKYLESIGKEVAIIYGGLPPGTKLAQASKFNDVNSPCKVLVATDAIGMGLNLCIRRVIFNSLVKPVVNEKGEKEMDVISVSQALQIAGRAGRYGTQWDQGYVTCLKPDDLNTLKQLLKQSPEPITQAGLMPTAEQIELYAYHLPNATLSNLMDIFVNLSTVDNSLYFMCQTEDFKFLAEMIQHVALPLKTRYVFCCAPINKRMPFVGTMFLKFARNYSRNEPITYNWLCRSIGWPLKMPNNIMELVHLEAVFDVLDLYLWLSYRFSDLFPDIDRVRVTQNELDNIIQAGVVQLTRLLKNSESITTNDDEGVKGANTKKGHLKSDNISVGRGRLTERLLSQGLLTPNMLEELKKEWSRGDSKNHNSNDESTIVTGGVQNSTPQADSNKKSAPKSTKKNVKMKKSDNGPKSPKKETTKKKK